MYVEPLREIASRWASEDKERAERQKYLAQPTKVMQDVANLAEYYSPSKKKVKTKAFTKYEALRRREEGGPLEGFQDTLLNTYQDLLSSDETLGVGREVLLAKAGESILGSSPIEEEGAPTYREKLYRGKWKADTGLGRLFGALGPDESVKTPPPMIGLNEKGEEQEVTYEDWKTAENARTAEETKSDWVGPLGYATWTLGLPLLYRIGKRALHRAPLLALPVPGARVAAAGMLAYDATKVAIGMLGGDVGFNIARHSEWARARQQEGKLDRADVGEFGAALLAGGLTDIGRRVGTAALRRLTSKGSKALADVAALPGPLKQLPAPSENLLPGTISMPPTPLLPPPVGYTRPMPGDSALTIVNKAKASKSVSAFTDEIRSTFKIDDYKMMEALLAKKGIGEIPYADAVRPVVEAVKPSAPKLLPLIGENPWVYQDPGENWFRKEFAKFTPDEVDAVLAISNRTIPGTNMKYGLKRATFFQSKTKDFKEAVAISAKVRKEAVAPSLEEWEMLQRKGYKVVDRRGAPAPTENKIIKQRKAQKVKEVKAEKKVKKAVQKTQKDLTEIEGDYATTRATSFYKAKGPRTKEEELVSYADKLVDLHRKYGAEFNKLAKAEAAPIMKSMVEVVSGKGAQPGAKALGDVANLLTDIAEQSARPKKPTASYIIRDWINKRHPFVFGVTGGLGLTLTSMLPTDIREMDTLAEEDAITKRVMDLSEDTETGWVATQNLTLQGHDIVGEDGQLSTHFKDFGGALLEATQITLSSLGDLFGAGEVGAATGATISKAAAPTLIGAVKKGKTAFMNMLKDFFDGGYVHVPLAEGAKSVERPVKALSTADMILEQEGTMRKALSGKTKMPLPRWLISPFGRAQVLYKSTAEKVAGKLQPTFYSPEPELASRQNARIWNIRDHLEATSNILKDVIPKRRTRAILKEMDPIAKEFRQDEIAYSALKMREELIDGKIKSAIKGIDKAALKQNKSDLNKSLKAKRLLEGELEKTRKALGEVTPKHEAFRAAWRQKVMELARKESSTRIALMVEDAHIHEGLKDLPALLTSQEREAVIYLKNMMQQYGKRFEEVGEKIISERAFIHHAWHPSWVKSAAEKRLSDLDISNDVVPFSRLFHRTKYSVQMSPDINYIMQRYIFDSERRLQMLRFWDQHKKFGKESWWTHYQWVKQFGDDELVRYWDRLKKRFQPPPENRLNALSNIYASVEVLRLIAFAPSTAFKHLFKNIGTASSLGIGEFASHIPQATTDAVKIMAHDIVGAVAPKMGIKFPAQMKKFEQQVAKSFMGTSKGINVFAGLDLEPSIRGIPGFWPAFERKMLALNKAGGSLISMIESVDRAHTFRAAVDLAAKKGYTTKQALYSYWSQILEMNFLSAEMNPTWARNPVTRALALFQNTAYKIFERRWRTAVLAGKDVIETGKIFKGRKLTEALDDLHAVGRWVVGLETDFKKNLILENLTSTKDIFGVPYIQRAMRETVLSGIVLGGGGAIGLNLFPQVMHVPFLAHGAHEPTLAANPIVHAIFRTITPPEGGGVKDIEDEEMFITSFLKEWLRGSGYMNMTANKAVRILKADVPTLYESDTGSVFPDELLYLFSVPRKKVLE